MIVYVLLLRQLEAMDRVHLRACRVYGNDRPTQIGMVLSTSFDDIMAYIRSMMMA